MLVDSHSLETLAGALSSRGPTSTTISGHKPYCGVCEQEIRKNTDSCNNPLVGLLMTERLSYDDQIHSIVGKLRKGLYALRANKALPPFAKRNIYFATIHSHLGYAGTRMKMEPRAFLVVSEHPCSSWLSRAKDSVNFCAHLYIDISRYTSRC